MPDSSEPPSRLFLCRPDRVGDVIIATSCLPAIRQQLPNTPITFVAHERMRPLLEGHPLLAGFVHLAATGHFLRHYRALVMQLPKDAGAAIVHLHPDAVCQIAGWSRGIGQRLGYKTGPPLDWTLTQRWRDLRAAGRKHEALYNFDLLAPLGIASPSLDSLRPSVHLSERWRESLAARMSGADALTAGAYLVLNPTAHSPVHRWPPEHFAWLAHELRERFTGVVLVGVHHDDHSVAAVRALLEPDLPGFLDLSGQLNLGELGWLLRHARLLVSRNTGTTHLAAAVGCPTIELFGRLEPRYGPTRWRALGPSIVVVIPAELARRKGESKSAFWRRGYASIPKERVLHAAVNLVGATAAGDP